MYQADCNLQFFKHSFFTVILDHNSVINAKIQCAFFNLLVGFLQRVAPLSTVPLLKFAPGLASLGCSPGFLLSI